jgi:hypothetical protein
MKAMGLAAAQEELLMLNPDFTNNGVVGRN